MAEPRKIKRSNLPHLQSDYNHFTKVLSQKSRDAINKSGGHGSQAWWDAEVEVPDSPAVSPMKMPAPPSEPMKVPPGSETPKPAIVPPGGGTPPDTSGSSPVSPQLTGLAAAGPDSVLAGLESFGTGGGVLRPGLGRRNLPPTAPVTALQSMKVY